MLINVLSFIEVELKNLRVLRLDGSNSVDNNTVNAIASKLHSFPLVDFKMNSAQSFLNPLSYAAT